MPLEGIKRSGVYLTLLPGVIMLALYFSLAIHMRSSLGQWPTVIGEGGFSAGLVTHVVLEGSYRGAFMLSCFLALLILLPCAILKRMRFLLPYLGLYILTFFLCGAMMLLLVPRPFVQWWLD